MPRHVLNYTQRLEEQKKGLKLTYGCFANSSFPELIEVDEEFLKSNSVSGDLSTDSRHNIIVCIKCSNISLEVAWVTSPAGAHGLDHVAEGRGSCHFICLS